MQNKINAIKRDANEVVELFPNGRKSTKIWQLDKSFKEDIRVCEQKKRQAFRAT